jgi:hypothetical protein
MQSNNAARDDVYSHMIARRAVARAALAVGVECMSQQSLDVLASVLLKYLSRVGQVLAEGVEASGRSSAHVNAIDALQAVEMCTTAAVQRVHVEGGNNGENGTNTTSVVPSASHEFANNDRSWRGLAEFCFGADWSLPDADENATNDTSNVDSSDPSMRVVTGAGGKVGPSATNSNNHNPNNLGNITSAVPYYGWNAPYPDEVPPFPLVVGKSPVANPHALPEAVGRSLHDASAMRSNSKGGDHRDDADAGDLEDLDSELQQIPDSLFVKEWGTLAFDQATSKSEGPLTADSDDAMDVDSPSPPAKRVRLQDVSEDVVEDDNDRILLPSFFPAFPKVTGSIPRTVLEQVEELQARKVVPDASIIKKTRPVDAAATADPTLTVRSALVSLDKHDYWGSSWQQQSSDLEDVVVPPGRSEMGAVQAQVVPLGRASGSRVSRIIEGSMEPSTLS